ncbi:winged helix DNA-binding protein [Altererythrobacter sp. MF3-039]|uniref:winged helix DNA-binding protein n=1 Tax=Altererythrobacter sp. MF3-039 TaxID=3252901 RepID=UPI00390CA12D
MAQADFAYPDSSRAGLGGLTTLSVFADDELARARLADDAASAGLETRQMAGLECLLAGDVRPLGEIILIDCPAVNGDTLAALLRLDKRAARADSQVIVSTRFDALEDVFACLTQADAQILVDPTRGERVLALGRALAKTRSMRVREFSDDERVTLIRLTEQVEEIAKRLDTFPERGGDGVFRFESPKSGFKGKDGTQEGRLRAAKPPLPDPRLVRAIISRRQKRRDYFDGALFADPAWDMLLDLTAARVEHRRVSVTSLCIASGVPATTALRWIAQMVESGLFERVEDDADKRRAFIGLTDRAADAMARYFAEIGGEVG